MRLARFLKRQAQKIDTDELQDWLVKDWYSVSRTMKMFIPITFPYFTFQGFVQEAVAAHEQTKDGKIGGKTQFLGN